MSAPAENLPLQALAALLRDARGIGHKRDIGDVMAVLGTRGLSAATAVPVGDDCAAIADGDGYLLFAIEGFVNEFVERQPWFAGYCGVMVNVSDIYAMGGRPVAVVDALWSRGPEAARPVLEGLAAGARAYGVPIVGGHTNQRNSHEQLSVAIIGRASRLLTSFDARAGDTLVAAIDLRGAFEEPYAYWNASTPAPADRLRADLELLPAIAEAGLAAAAKDVSMAGILGTALMLLECSRVLGTALMLLECSRVGAVIDIDAIPRPPGVALHRWLTAFPSYGFLLSVPGNNVQAVLDRFRARGIGCAAIGRVDGSRQLTIRREGDSALLWNLAQRPGGGASPC